MSEYFRAPRPKETFAQVRGLYDAMTREEQYRCMVAAMEAMCPQARQCVLNGLYCTIVGEINRKAKGEEWPFPI